MVVQVQTQVGYFNLKWNAEGLLDQLEFSVSPLESNTTLPVPVHFSVLVQNLKNYFTQGIPIEQIPWEILNQSQWTEFQKSVYQAIARIPHGETRTYSWVASRIGKPLAVRAVGQALRNNPIPVLIPCHRVVSANSLGGFMGTNNPEDPEMKLKKFLLKTEEEYLNPVFCFLQSSA